MALLGSVVLLVAAGPPAPAQAPTHASARPPSRAGLPIDRLEALARGGDTGIVAAVRERPDDARELLRRLLVQAGSTSAPAADSVLLVARRLGDAYARAWEDSFPLAQVERFTRMDPARRAAKIGADSVRRAGNDALGDAGVSAALAIWRAALRRSSEIADTAGIAGALGNLGAGFYRDGELDSAEVYLERARALAETIGDRRTAVNALGTLGSVAKDRGDLRRAQALYARALVHRGRIGDMRGAASDHNNLGLLSAELGDLAAARAHYEEALALARRHDLDDPAAAALINLGNVASVEAQYAQAARRYGDALAIYRAAGAEADAALVLHNLGLLALRRGDYGTARARLREALAIFARAGTAADVVLVRRDLASVSAAVGDLRGAVEQLRRAERLLAGESGAADLVAAVALARADLAALLNDLPDAEREYARAEALSRDAGDGAGEAEAQTGRALLLVERGQHARAIELLRLVARAQRDAGERRPAALTDLMIGFALHRQKDLPGARAQLLRAADTLRALDDPVGEAAALAALGDVALDAGTSVAAEALYRRGLARLRGRVAATVSWQLHAGLGHALQAQGALDGAAAELRAAAAQMERVAGTLTLEERRASFLADKWDVYGQLALVERARGDAAAGFAASERMRARQMLDLLARGRIAPGAADSSLIAREQDLRRRVAELAQQLELGERGAQLRRGGDIPGAAGSGAIRDALARAHEEYADLLLDLRDQSMSTAAIVRGEVAAWRDVARRLAPDEALLEYLVSDSATVAFVITADTLRAVDLGVGRRALETLVDFLRGTLVRPLADAPTDGGSAGSSRAPLRRLHRHLIAPLEESGALANVRRLIVVPHVELHYLPFAALIRQDPAAGGRDEYLIERYEIAYAPSASVWVRLGQRADSARGHAPGDERVLALAPRTATLPGSRQEVEAIRALYGRQATVLTNGAASEAAFRSSASRYDIVHLATYGVLNKHNPLFSFVSLSPGTDADGRMEVHEVFELGLHARLLVLSACQTALGSGALSDVPAGDDWVSLVRAFLGAGASSVIATLWPVEDRSTARAMEGLYRRMRAGDAEVSALAGAQREMLRRSETADPFYWGGFVLVGGQ